MDLKYDSYPSYQDYGPQYADLPMEIIINIYEYLHPMDRMSAGMTCKRWQEGTQHSNFTADIALAFSKITFSDTQPQIKQFLSSNREFPAITFNSVEFGAMQQFWNRFGDGVSEIDFKLCDIREKKFVMIMRNLSNLHTLRVEGCRELFMSGRLFEGDEDKKNILAAFRTLRTLSLAHNRYLSDALFNRIVALTSNLENIDLSGCCISFHKGLYKKFYPASQLVPSESVLTFHYISQFLEQTAAKVKHLNFSSTLIDGTALTTLAETEYLKLLSLNLKSCDQLTNPGIFSLVTSQTQLQSLDLSMSLRITDQSLIHICNGLTQLKSLKIRRCRALTDLGIKELVKLEHLEVLDISECESITGEGITAGIASKVNHRLRQIYVSALNLCESSIMKIVESFPNLVVLDLSYCFNGVTDLVIQMIFKHLIWLRHLNLELCDKISDAAMTGMGMVEKVTNYEENPSAATTSTASPPTSLAGEGVDNETLRRMMLPKDDIQVQFKKISLRSKAEEEIVNDAKRKKAMLEMCEQNLLETEASGYSISRLRGLRVLKLSGCNRISDVSLKYSFKLPELRELTIARCQQVSIIGIQPLVKKCPSLEMLDLTECHNISDKAIEVITQHLARLSNLSLERCAQLTDFSLDYIAVNCKNLRTLDVRGCRGMNSEPNLRLVNLTTLRNISMSKPGPYVVDKFSLKKPRPPPFPF